MKKAFSVIIITALIFMYAPLYAFSQNKQITEENTITEYINIDWWKDLDDPILLNYIVKAIQCNQDLKISTLKVEEARENKNQKRANELPSLGIGAVPALYKLPGITNSDGLISLPVYANYEIDLFGKNRDKTKAMDKLYEVSRYNEKASYISVVSAVGSAYYNIVKLDELIRIQENIIQDRKEIYDLMELSNENGLVSTADTVAADKAYIKANADITDLKKTREKLLNMLAVLIGESPNNSDSVQRIAFDDLKIKKQIPQSIPSVIIQSRPDYLAAEKMLEKAGLDVLVAKKEFLPAFNILGLISFNSTEYFQNMNWTNSLAILGGGALLPLFTGGRKISNLKLQKNKYEQLAESYKKVNLTSVQEVNDALCDLKLDNEKFNKTLESFTAEQKDFYFTELKFEEGVISKLDLLQKRETLLSTQKLVTTDTINYFINQIGLYKAVAGADI